MNKVIKITSLVLLVFLLASCSTNKLATTPTPSNPDYGFWGGWTHDAQKIFTERDYLDIYMAAQNHFGDFVHTDYSPYRMAVVVKAAGKGCMQWIAYVPTEVEARQLVKRVLETSCPPMAVYAGIDEDNIHQNNHPAKKAGRFNQILQEFDQADLQLPTYLAGIAPASDGGNDFWFDYEYFNAVVEAGLNASHFTFRGYALNVGLLDLSEIQTAINHACNLNSGKRVTLSFARENNGLKQAGFDTPSIETFGNLNAQPCVAGLSIWSTNQVEYVKDGKLIVQNMSLLNRNLEPTANGNALISYLRRYVW